MIDLHVHSTFSDGTLTPTQLVEHAMENHLTAFALTDHDTVDGLGEAFQAAEDKPIKVISGIEFSTEYNGQDIHIVGLDFDWHDTSFCQELDHFRNCPVLNGIVKWLKSLPTVDFRSLSRLCRKCLVMPF